MILTALITVPDDWTKEEVADMLVVGLRAEIVQRWRKDHGKQSWPPATEFEKVKVNRMKYPHTKEEPVQTEPESQEEKQPRLDRKTRGMVRRVTNKLQTVERREFPSSSNPNRKYQTVIYQNGKVLCNCQGWTMKKGSNPRQCRHTAELIGDRSTKTDGEFLYIESLAIATGTLSFSEEGAC